MTQEE